MSIADMVFTITDPTAPVPSIPHLTIAEMKALNDIPDRTVRMTVECKGTLGDEDDWTDETPCTFAGEADVAVFDDFEEAIWHCPDGHENSIRWESI